MLQETLWETLVFRVIRSESRMFYIAYKLYHLDAGGHPMYIYHLL
jgi:hypothetical protein